MNEVRVRIPLAEPVRNRGNGSHGHWGARSSERRELRETVFTTLSYRSEFRAAYARWIMHANRSIPVLRADSWLAGELTVLVVRVSPHRLDKHDGLPHAFKSTVDAIADALGLRSDRDRRVEWRYDQRAGEPGENAIEISITTRRTCPTCGQIVVQQQEQAKSTTKKRAERASAGSGT